MISMNPIFRLLSSFYVLPEAEIGTLYLRDNKNFESETFL